MKKITILLTFLFLGITAGTAESIVYVICISSHVPIPVKIDNHEAFTMKGEQKGNRYATVYSACKKKCVLNTEGKVLFSFDYLRDNYANKDNKFHHADEILLNLSDGSEHYVHITNKGMNDMQFKELDEKEGKKLWQNKKLVSTPDYIEPK